MLINECVKYLRLALYMEQKEFGKLLGVGKSAICLYEKGARKPRLRTIKRMIELVKKHHIDIKIEDFMSE